MNKKELREYQIEQLSLIKEVNRVCQQEGIKYYIICGTLLGAVRHKGFIPWDADMDIGMRRDDYERFRKYWESQSKSSFFFQHYLNEKNHLSPHGILRLKGTHVSFRNQENEKYKPKYDGVYLDVFPIDEAPVEKKKQIHQYRQVVIINKIVEQKMARVYEDNISPLKLIRKKIVQIILTPLTLKYLHTIQDKIMQKYNGCKSGLLVNLVTPYKLEQQLMDERIYGTPQKVLFEGIECFAPEDSHSYLQQLYGNYMKIPDSDHLYDFSETITWTKD